MEKKGSNKIKVIYIVIYTYRSVITRAVPYLERLYLLRVREIVHPFVCPSGGVLNSRRVTNRLARRSARYFFNINISDRWENFEIYDDIFFFSRTDKINAMKEFFAQRLRNVTWNVKSIEPIFSLQRLYSETVEQRCQSVSRMQCRNVSATLAGRKAATTCISYGTRPLPLGAWTKASFPAGQSTMPTFGLTPGRPKLNLGRFRQPKFMRARRTGRRGGRSRTGKPCRVTTSDERRSNETGRHDSG